jgi:SAM-dependent methyltransferase/glycosyltransferase involved in cell wall biosynthesis
MDICTIIAKNYVAQARVLAHSLSRHDPGSSCFVLIIDEYNEYIDPQTEPFTILTPAQVGCAEFPEMALRYDVLELSTAIKPWLLRHLLSEGAPSITYLDPDICVYSSLQALDQLARDHGVVLIPHNTEPLPDDGHRPNQVDILLAGVYNLGYVSLGAGAEIDRLLGWWQQRLLNDCRVDPLNGYFVDQRWFDLAPGLVADCAIMREPQYNIAYWNLHGRRLEHNGEHYTVDGQPLAFFHFSGFDPLRPDVLSRHQSRVSVAEHPALARLCCEYAGETIAAGYRVARAWPYTYHRLANGLEFDKRLRNLHEIASKQGEVWGSPFTSEGCESFIAWLAQPAPAAPAGVNRLLADMYGTREDLQEEFPEVAGADHESFLRWARELGVEQEPALGLLVERADQAAYLTQQASGQETHSPEAEREGMQGPEARRQGKHGSEVHHQQGAHSAETDRQGVPALQTSLVQPLESSWGVNVVGYFRSELGVGEAARQLVSALDAYGVPLLPLHGRTIPPNRQGHAYAHLRTSDARFLVNLICMNADVLPEFAAQAGKDFFDARHTIGMWFWEVARFPGRYATAFDHIDELWLASEHMVRAIAPHAPVPVAKIVLPVQLPPVMPLSREDLGLPQSFAEGFLFFYTFDHHSVFERKNPLAVIEAYRQAFAPEDGARLLIRSINAAAAPEHHDRLLAAAGRRTDIEVIDGYLSPAHKDAMLAQCDCYVSLHRAEGFGLGMAEAMYLGRPVIATGYSGNLDFMTAQNSYLVDHTLVQIGPNAGPYPAGGEWAEPDLEHAARLMREVFDSPDAAARRGALAAGEIRRTHSPAAAGEVMGRRLEQLRTLHGERLAAARAQRTVAAVLGLNERIATGPAVAVPSRFGLLGRLMRRVLLRALRPYSAYQQSVNADIVRSLNAGIEGLEQTTALQHAALLAQSRDATVRHELLGQIAGLARFVKAHEVTITELQGEVGRRLEELDRSLKQLVWEGRALPYMSGAPYVTVRHPVAGIVQGYSDVDLYSKAEGVDDATGGGMDQAVGEDADKGAGESANKGSDDAAGSNGAARHGGAEGSDTYRSFEDIFRGSEDFIRERQRPYLELLAGREPVLEFGCGRGEFIDLLREQGVTYVGVDRDEGMVRRCREKGHTEVVQGDGIAYLAGVADGSLGAIFSAQVIEHLPYEMLLRLLTLARAKLREDGLLIAETVNPHSPAALKTFWVDLTHQQPIFPEVALALCRDAGFASAYVFHPGGCGDVEHDRFSEGAFTVVANTTESLPMTVPETR